MLLFGRRKKPQQKNLVGFIEIIIYKENIINMTDSPFKNFSEFFGLFEIFRKKKRTVLRAPSYGGIAALLKSDIFSLVFILGGMLFFFYLRCVEFILSVSVATDVVGHVQCC